MRRLNKYSLFILILTIMATSSGCSNPLGSNKILKEENVTQSVKPVDKTVDQSNFYYVSSAKKALVQIEDTLLKNQMGKRGDVYYYNFADLNDDRENEILIFIRHEKETSEGRLVVLSSDYEEILMNQVATPPVVVLNLSAGSLKGFKDLAIYLDKGKYRRYQLIDNAYQLSENSKENVIEFSEIKGVGYLSDVNDKNGFIIQ